MSPLLNQNTLLHIELLPHNSPFRSNLQSNCQSNQNTINKILMNTFFWLTNARLNDWNFCLIHRVSVNRIEIFKLSQIECEHLISWRPHRNRLFNFPNNLSVVSTCAVRTQLQSCRLRSSTSSSASSLLGRTENAESTYLAFMNASFTGNTGSLKLLVNWVRGPLSPDPV